MHEKGDWNQVPDRETLGGRVESAVAQAPRGPEVYVEHFVGGPLVEESAPGEIIEKRFHRAPNLARIRNRYPAVPAGFSQQQALLREDSSHASVPGSDRDVLDELEGVRDAEDVFQRRIEGTIVPAPAPPQTSSGAIEAHSRNQHEILGTQFARGSGRIRLRDSERSSDEGRRVRNVHELEAIAC